MFRSEPRDGRKSGLVRMGIRGLSGLVGLASESIKDQTNHENDKPGLKKRSTLTLKDDNNEEKELVDELETDWDLDESQTAIAEEPLGEQPKMPQAATSIESSKVLDIDSFLALHPPSDAKPGVLPLPVVLPQRRPKDRTRGFIRAYAPVLENCGIDQTMWISMINTLNKASMADPWLNAINLAAIGTNFIPYGLGIFVSIAIQEATNAVIELQGRYRTSTALDLLNESFFRPRGLCCIVMTWNPRSTGVVEAVDISDTIASSTTNQSSGDISQKFRSSDGHTYGDLAFPEVAPLVFPGLDELAAMSWLSAEQKRSRIVQSMVYVANYWDKRATAEYAMKNPDSVLSNVPQSEFSSRYADPSHAAASGSPISFVLGGKLIPGPHSRGLISGLASVGRQAARGEKQGESWEAYNKAQRGRVSMRADLVAGTPVLATIKRLFRQDVLYLMVINLPTEEEMEKARTLKPPA